MIINITKDKTKLIFAVFLIILGIVGRFALVKYVGIPNLEIITVLALISGIYLGGAYAVIVPLLIIFLSDLVIGNTYIFIFTWTAFIFIGLFGILYRNKVIHKKCQFDESKNQNKIIDNKFQNSIILALISSLFFYLYTNFGWWLMSGMYEYSLSGLIRCYYMAIPFFKNNLVGNLIFVPVGVYFVSRVFYNIREFSILKINYKTPLFIFSNKVKQRYKFLK